MTALRFILASLRHFRRIHFAVTLGVAVATAVLTGALLVGDSVRGSLRDLTLQRLGYIDSALVAGHFFRARLAEELATNTQFKRHFKAAEPAILISGTLQSGSGDEQRRATRVHVIGYGKGFWSLGQGGAGGAAQSFSANEVAITEPLAHELKVKTGDEIQLRIPTGGAIPADSPLGDKEDTSRFGRFRVGAVLPPRGLARFGLMPSQQLPRNLFVPLGELQDLLDKPSQANAILVGSSHANRAADIAARLSLQAALRPLLVDYGLKIETLSEPSNAMQIVADQLVLSGEVVSAAEQAFQSTNLQPVATYLANTISVGNGGDLRKIPYSTITGVDSTAALGPLLDEAGKPIVLADDEIVLNRWAADDLGAEIGDDVTVTFYEPESTHGQLHERRPPPKFKLRAIVELEDADGKPTGAADPQLTPELPGVTDQESIADWDLPFELVEKIRPQDEEYWDKYRTTPKAFVSLATAKRLWNSRWGTISLMRLAPPQTWNGATSVNHKLVAALKPADVGMNFLPVKELGLLAASGTTPFDALFLGFSMFLIAAAVMLIALLFQLGIQHRAAELGTLAAVGIDRKRITKLLSREGLIVAAIGALVGVAAGVGYAWLMIVGLRTWWLAAISTPFLELYVTPLSLVIGWLIGVVVSWLTIRWSIRRLVRLPTNQLLHGSIAGELRPPDRGRTHLAIWSILRIAFMLLTIALGYAGSKLNGEAQAGAFFGSGAVVLALLLGEIRHRLRTAHRTTNPNRAFTLPVLSTLNTARNPGRSTLTIGLVAAATFLIVAISAFRLDTGEGGTGGFALIATSDQPIHYDLNTLEGRLKLSAFKVEQSEALEAWRIYSLRVATGEDASCLNMYRPTQPRVFGVPESLIERGGFDAVPPNPWPLLHNDLGNGAEGKPIVPVVLDASTAIYSLHLNGVGSRFEIRDAADRPVTLEVVGLLKNSVLQGNLLVSEANFLRMFPDTSGYRYFLIEPRPVPSVERNSPAAESVTEVATLLETTLASDGFDATTAADQLAGFLAVQNTYLSTFQSLGALGLLLGTIGLAVVQLRSVLERRSELALMRATGFRRSRLVRMVVWENAVLLIGGLAVGCIAAAVALIPQWAPQRASVPWATVAALLGTIAIVGLIAGWLATRSALRAPLVPALRGD
ncbi:MAG: ABC transporter permease [Pirellulales bacterium]